MIWWPEESPTLQSGTITMRPMRPSDAEDIFKAAQDPTIPKFTTLPENYPLDLAIEFAGKRAAASFTNKTELVFVVEDSRLGRDAGSNSGSGSSSNSGSGSSSNSGSGSSSNSGSGSSSNSGSGSVNYPYSNNFAGVMSLHSVDIPNHRAEIGYWLAKEARGLGICTKAAEMITEYGLMSMGFMRIDGIVDVRNEPSKKALLNAGYEFEGIMKNYVTRSKEGQLDMALFAATK
jgi:RimJ/RimL family protein N-acetyltransferase